MAIVEEGQCRIDYLNSNGLGVSKESNISLPYTLPEEVARFEKHRYRHQSRALGKGIVTLCPNRIEAPCTYFGTCGGCALQHLNSKDYRDFKYNLIAESLKANSLATEID